MNACPKQKAGRLSLVVCRLFADSHQLTPYTKLKNCNHKKKSQNWKKEMWIFTCIGGLTNSSSLIFKSPLSDMPKPPITSKVTAPAVYATKHRNPGKEGRATAASPSYQTERPDIYSVKYRRKKPQYSRRKTFGSTPFTVVQ